MADRLGCGRNPQTSKHIQAFLYRWAGSRKEAIVLEEEGREGTRNPRDSIPIPHRKEAQTMNSTLFKDKLQSP
jgi:hypothetical protein